MNAPTPSDITVLLRAAQAGDRAAFDDLYQVVYQHLRAVARTVRARRNSPTLNTTALVHEAYLKLVPAPAGEVRDREHFFAIAARAMRQVLVDAARRRSTARKAAEQPAVELQHWAYRPEEAGTARAIAPEDLLALDEALGRLLAWSPRQASVVECRVFAGLSVEETARALGVSEPTVKRDWHMARAWLAHELGGA
jgi:RNA polymerase sigma factor (TIGR02999 family)